MNIPNMFGNKQNPNNNMNNAEQIQNIGKNLNLDWKFDTCKSIKH